MIGLDEKFIADIARIYAAGPVQGMAAGMSWETFLKIRDSLRIVLLPGDVIQALDWLARLQRNALSVENQELADQCAHATRVIDGLYQPPAPPPQYGSEVLCETCAGVFCPHGERGHFFHDGCPQCDAPGADDEEIVDADRAAAMAAAADATVIDLDIARADEQARIEAANERQMADLERESSDE